MSKCLPILDQMPPEIMEKIVGFTDTFDKFRLRQCCKYFKQIVDTFEIVFNCLEFCWREYNKYATVYVQDHYHSEKKFNDENPEDSIEYAISALKFLGKVLKSHPKIHLVKLIVTFDIRDFSNRERMMEEVSRVFSGLDNKLPVERVEIESMQNEQLLMSVFPHLVPGTLRRVNLRRAYIQDTGVDFSRVFETEQWKQAKELYFNYRSIGLEGTHHFEIMERNIPRLTMEYVQKIVENILRDNGWKKRDISAGEYDKNAIEQYLLQFNYKILQNNDAILNMTIRRDGYGCEIKLSRWYRNWVFKRIDSVS